MQIQEAFTMRKIEGSIRSSVGIMKDVNSLIRLPELTGTMQELAQELIKAGIIGEMIEDCIPEELEQEEEEEEENEVQKVLGEILSERVIKVSHTPKESSIMPQETTVENEDEEDAEAILDEMRGRLEALKS